MFSEAYCEGGSTVVTVACVLRSGGDYKRIHVDKLRRQVERWMPTKHNFVCLDDKRLEHGWPGWWSKIELFKPGQFEGRVLYIDLDNIICGPLNPLIRGEGTIFMKDLHLPMISSSVMAWDAGDLDHIYESFAADPVDAMDIKHKPQGQGIYGDQTWINMQMRGHDYKYFQDVAPGSIIQWNKRRTRKTSVACFFFRNKPWNTDGWASRIWKRA